MGKQPKKKSKGKAPAEVSDCGGNQCEMCKECCNKVQQKLDVTNLVLTKLREDNKAVLAREVSLNENIIALKERIQPITDDRDQLNMTLQETSVKKKKNGSGRWSKRHLSGDDLPAQEIVSTVVKEVLFLNMKTLPAGWENENDEPTSVYELIMGLIDPPHGLSKEGYWEETVREAVNYKFGQLKRQASIKVKKRVCVE